MTVSTMLYLLIALLCSRNQGFAAGKSLVLNNQIIIRLTVSSLSVWRVVGQISEVGTWVRQLRRNAAAVVSRRRHFVRFGRPGK